MVGSFNLFILPTTLIIPLTATLPLPLPVTLVVLALPRVSCTEMGIWSCCNGWICFNGWIYSCACMVWFEVWIFVIVDMFHLWSWSNLFHLLHWMYLMCFLLSFLSGFIGAGVFVFCPWFGSHRPSSCRDDSLSTFSNQRAMSITLPSILEFRYIGRKGPSEEHS